LPIFPDNYTFLRIPFSIDNGPHVDFVFTLPDPLRLIGDLLDLPFVKDCSIHGASLHVVVKDHASIEQLAAYTGVQPQLIVPTLDDVFIALAKRQESEVPA
jgi:hypothetical protein